MADRDKQLYQPLNQQKRVILTAIATLALMAGQLAAVRHLRFLALCR